MKKDSRKEIKRTAQSKYRCLYHIVFAPKYRRKEIYGKLRIDIGEILKKLCEQKGAESIEAEACPDHIHQLNQCAAVHSYSTIHGLSQGQK